MLLDEGSIKTENTDVAPALNLYRKKLKTVALISIIAGVAGIIMYIVGSVLDMEDGETPRWVDIFLFFAVPFALGLIGYITIIRLGKREKADGRTSECLFYADCFFYTSKSSAQSQTVDKFFYSDAVLKRENKKYGYIFVTSRVLFLVFSKEGLKEEALNAIRKNFGKPFNGETVELKNYEKNN